MKSTKRTKKHKNATKQKNKNANKQTKIKIVLKKHLRERRQLGFVKLDGNLAISGWVGLAYDC